MLLLLLVVSASDAKMDPFIVGGQKASIKDWPFIVYIVTNQFGPVVNSCGGSLLSSQTVLTAAHCLDDVTDSKALENATTHTIFMGHSRYDEATMIRKVLDYETHNSYSPDDSDVRYDIGVMFLASPVTFSRYVKKVILQRSFNYTRDNRLAVAGWGAIDMDGHIGSKELKSLDLLPAAYSQCEKRYKAICTAINDEEYAFSGDSGGPMVNAKTRHQLGLVSYRDELTGMTVFTSVPEYWKWLELTQLKMFKSVKYKIYMGHSSFKKSRLIRSVKDYETHHNYDPDNKDVRDDIGIMFLNRPVKFIDNVEKTILVKRKFNSQKDKHLLVAGWGRVDIAKLSTISENLKDVKLRSMSFKECAKKVPYIIHIQKVVCAAPSHEFAYGGDSGGPLVERRSHHQLGLVSFRNEYSEITVFTSVPAYYQWINRTNLNLYKKHCRKL